MLCRNPLESLVEERKAVQTSDAQRPQGGDAPDCAAPQHATSAEPPSPGGTRSAPKQADLDFFTQVNHMS